MSSSPNLPKAEPLSQETGSASPPPARSDSFRAISELLRWAYGYRLRPTEPVSTQRDPETEEYRTSPAFDASVWGEASEVPTSPVGERLGRFEIGRELGRGGFGVVRLAVDTRLERKVALKLPRPDRAQNTAIWTRFAREARLAASLDHEAIVPVLDAGLIDGTFYIATAYQKGVPLSRWLMRYPGGIAPRAAATLMIGIASGLAYAHARGVLHRDLKPGNVLMVTADDQGDSQSGGTLPQPKITDFGLGTLEGEGEPVSDSGSWNGTPPYMAPEQLLADRGPVDSRSDIYATGAILYEMLTGCPIYPCRTIKELGVEFQRGVLPVPPRQIRGAIPRDLERVCLKCLEHEPDQRYASTSALRDDLSRFLRGEPVEARPLLAWARLGRWVRRNPSRAALVGVALSAGVLILGLIAKHEAELSATNKRLQAANQDLESSITTLRSTMENLRTTEEATRKATYAADLHLAAQEIDSGRVEVGQAILLRQKPEAEHKDLREFAWDLLWHRATRSHEVSSLEDLSWWKGPTPPLSSDRRAHLFNGEVRLNPLEIVAEDNHASVRFDGTFRRVFDIDEQRRLLDSLWYDDGQNRVPLPIRKGRPRLGEDGSTLVVSDLEWIVPLGDAPTPRIRSLSWTEDVRARHPGLPAGGLRVVEVPSTHTMTLSDDGRKLALQAHISGRSAVVPLIYDLDSGRGRSFADLAEEPRIGTDLPSDASPRTRGLLSSIALSPDGRLAAVSGWAPRLSAFETQSGLIRWTLDASVLGNATLVTCIAFSPDLKVLLTGDSSGNVHVWDMANNGAHLARFPVNLNYVRAVGWYPDARTAAILANGEDRIRFWKYAPDPPKPDRMNHGDEVWDLAFVAGGTVLASSGDDHRIRLWDPTSCKLLKTFRARRSLVTTLAIGGSDERVFSGDFSGQIAECTVGEHGGFVEGPAGHPLFGGKPIRALARSPDGNYLVAGGESSQLWIRDLVHGVDRFLSTSHPREIRAIAFSPDGHTLVLGSDDCSMTVWDFPALKLRSTIKTQGPITCVAISTDSRRLVSADTEGQLDFWDSDSPTPFATIRRATESGGVWDLAFSPDGKTIASAGDDGAVRLWDPESAHELLKLEGHSDKVHAVAFSPDGKTLASADFTGKILLHRTKSSGVHPQ